MRVRIPLKDLKLWWPAWQIAIPITSYGYPVPGRPGKIQASSEDYTFYVDPEMDSLLVKQGEFLPLSEAALICVVNPVAPSRIPYTSFSVNSSGKVQVNHLVIDEYGTSYDVRSYNVKDLYIEGESYSEDD